MPLNLQRIAYTIPSHNPLVQICLSRKRRLANTARGVGHASCCACMEHTVRSQARYAFGNSRTHPSVHGEGCAVIEAMERCQIDLASNGGSIRDLIPRIYIELSPCDRCRPMLEDINPDLEVLYSWQYPDELDEWREAAHELCYG